MPRDKLQAVTDEAELPGMPAYEAIARNGTADALTDEPGAPGISPGYVWRKISRVSAGPKS